MPLAHSHPLKEQYSVSTESGAEDDKTLDVFRVAVGVVAGSLNGTGVTWHVCFVIQVDCRNGSLGASTKMSQVDRWIGQRG